MLELKFENKIRKPCVVAVQKEQNSDHINLKLQMAIISFLAWPFCTASYCSKPSSFAFNNAVKVLI
jgi:hypothetical protein